MIPVELAKTPELSRLKREYHIAEARYWRKAGINQRNNFVYGRLKESA